MHLKVHLVHQVAKLLSNLAWGFLGKGLGRYPLGRAVLPAPQCQCARAAVEDREGRLHRSLSPLKLIDCGKFELQCLAGEFGLSLGVAAQTLSQPEFRQVHGSAVKVIDAAQVFRSPPSETPNSVTVAHA